MTVSLKGMREEKAAYRDQCEKILNRASRSGRQLTREEDKEFDDLMEKVKQLSEEIDKQERLDRSSVAQYLRDSEAEPTLNGLTPRERCKAFNAWARVGSSLAPTESGLQLAKRAGFSPYDPNLTFDLPESRAMGVGEATKGQKAVPQGMSGHLHRAMLSFGAVRNHATVVKTDGGGDLRFPTSNDTGNSGRLLAESTQVTATDVLISELTLGAFKYSSDIVLVSVELLQDESIDLEKHIGDILGERLGRITNAHATTGTGSGQPNGIVTASTIAATVASPTAVTYANLVDLQHSIDPAYQENAQWMFNFSTLAALKKIVDGDSRPLWQPAAGAGMGAFPETLLNKPIVINQQMPSMAADAKAILYGDCSKYLWREVRDVQLLRLNERYADYHQVAFLAFYRFDGDLLNAGTNPIKCIRMAGS